jgi:hypothetical protein
MFPLGKPFKCLYAIYALREHLAAQIQQASTIIFHETLTNWQRAF